MIGSKILENIRNHGFTRIYFPVDDLAQKAMEGFLNFLKEPLEYRRLWIFDRGNEMEMGYLPRDKPINKMTGYAYDYKNVFHLSPELLQKLIERKVSLREHEKWLMGLYGLYDNILRIGYEITSEFEKTYPSLHIMNRVKEAAKKRKNVLRLLHYHMKKREDGLIGLGHKDESFLTIHLADNFPGLKIGREGKTNLITTSHNISLVYPGKKAEHITKNDIYALWHEVIDTRSDIPTIGDETKNSDIHRLAIVFFLDIEM